MTLLFSQLVLLYILSCCIKKMMISKKLIEYSFFVYFTVCVLFSSTSRLEAKKNR